jgi:PTS system nitrogen regulatory IIA component
MQLTLRQAAMYLDVSEAVARRWITQKNLPVHRVHERIYLNATELWEWAMENGLPVSRRLLEHAQRSPDNVPPISELLRTGGIFHDVEAHDKTEALRQIVARLPLPEEQNREALFSVLEAREALGSTAIGHGIAIPHVRNPIVLHVEKPFVTLCLLRNPVMFDSIDGQPVHSLFMVISPTVTMHLNMLGKLVFLLRDEMLRGMLRERASSADIIGRMELLESTLTSGPTAIPTGE